MHAMQLAVVGNGATAVDAAGRCHANRHTARFLADLAARGHRVAYLEPHVRLQAHGNLQDGELPPHLVQAVAVDKRSPVALWRAGQVLCQADLAYIFYPGTVPRLAAGLCRRMGRPYAIYLRGERFETTGADAANLRGARFICCVGGLGARVRGLNRHVVPIQPMLDLIPADAKRRDFIGRDDSPWRLLFVGRLEGAKGVPELLQAAELLRARGLRFELTLVGGGPLHAELAARHGNLPGAPVRVTGIIDNKTTLHAAYEDADLFVLPTHHEGFPRVLYEAMMKSNVILTTFVGGIPGLLRDGHDALRLPVGDAAGIAEVIASAVTDRTRMQALADAGHSTVHSILQRQPNHLTAVVDGIANLQESTQAKRSN
jgi:glycosyltransferase involved in cell wall biosynthesis